jgi:hypothetical protein
MTMVGGPIVIDKCLKNLCQNESTPLIVAKMISLVCGKRAFNSVLLIS